MSVLKTLNEIPNKNVHIYKVEVTTVGGRLRGILNIFTTLKKI